MALRISPDLALPIDAVTETFAILAVKRAGKSNAAVVMAEEMYDAGVPWVAVDPKGDWWGVRAAGDGQAPGLAVLVFGGLHGDVPLEPSAGRLVADLIAEKRITCVLDVSEMSKADQRRFLTDFADRLYRRNTEPLHVFCEEADEYIPQRVMGESAKLVGAFETLVKRGGFRGIGVTLITQRSASLNKDVLTQAGTLIAMRTPSPQDRKAVLAWIDYHAASKDVIDELPTLDAGQAWVFSPQWLQTLVRIRFRRRRTFDSGATPKVGGKPRPPARLADVDLAAIKEQMAETIERAKADDPKALRARIRDLERQLAEKPAATVERVDVPVITEQDREDVRLHLQNAIVVANKLTEIVDRWSALLGDTTPTMQAASTRVEAVQRGSSAPRRPRSSPGESTTPGAADGGKTRQGRAETRPDAPAGLGRAERAILTAIVQRPDSPPAVIGFLAQYSPKSSSFSNALGRLRSLGLVAPGQPLRPLDGAESALGGVDPLPGGDELRRFWLSRLGKAEAALLDVLIEAWPRALTKDELSSATGYSATSSSFSNALGRLRSLLLCVKGDLLATDELMTALGGDR